MKALAMRFLFLVIFLLVLQNSLFAQTSRTTRSNYIGLITSYMGFGANYNYYFSEQFGAELQYVTGSATTFDSQLSTSSVILSGKYFPLETFDLFFSLAYLINDWKADIKDAYADTTTEYNLEKKWGSGLGVGAGIDFFGSFRSVYNGSFGLIISAPQSEEYKFKSDGGGTAAQKDEAITKYKTKYKQFDTHFYLYASLGYRF